MPLRYNMRSLLVRKTTTGASAAGLALVVFVLMSVLMFSNGLRGALGKSARRDAVIVLRKGASTEIRSGIDAGRVGAIVSSPDVARSADGTSRAVAELVAGVRLTKTGSDGTSNVQVRGVPEGSVGFRGVTIVAGRAARAGTDEAIVGAAIRGRFADMDLDHTVELPNQHRITIVGFFEDGGSAFESEIWADLDRTRSAFGLQGVVSSVRVELGSAQAFQHFKVSVEAQGQGTLDVIRETDYYDRQARGMNLLVQALALLIASLTCIGAMIGATITMHTSVSQRRREIATLRALGFTRTSILGAFLFESALLAMVGGAAGALASLALANVRLSMDNYDSGAQIVFAFESTPTIVLGSLAAAALMGVAGGLAPAIRAARMNPVEAMRE